MFFGHTYLVLVLCLLLKSILMVVLLLRKWMGSWTDFARLKLRPKTYRVQNDGMIQDVPHPLRFTTCFPSPRSHPFYISHYP